MSDIDEVLRRLLGTSPVDDGGDSDSEICPRCGVDSGCRA